MRAENAALRARMGQEGAAGTDTEPTPGAGRVGRQRWRSIVATLMIVVACVLAPLSVVAIWTRNQVTNTDRYVATVTPLASDPAVQQAITDQITAQVFTYIDIQALTTQVADALSARVEGRGLPPQAAAALQGLAGPVANGVQGFVRTQVERIVQSQAFEDAWIQANRVAHEALVKALTGEGGGAVTVEGDTVSLNLAPFIQTVKQQLVAQGFTLAERIPQVDKSFVLFQSEDITRAPRGVQPAQHPRGVAAGDRHRPAGARGVRGQGPPPGPGRRRARGRRLDGGAGPGADRVPVHLPGRRPGGGPAP